MKDWTDKIALVTGSSRGIGRAAATALAALGLDIVVHYRSNREEADKTCASVRELGRRAIPVQADVSLSKDVLAMAEKIAEDFGPVQVVVNNAGISRPQPIDRITEQDWDELIAVNLKSAFLVTQAFLPEMRARHWGRIINLSSIAAQTGGVVGPHYAASKAGLLGLTHSYAALLAREGITANAVSPALIATEMLLGNPNVTPDLIPLGRFGAVEEVADVIVMLVKDGYITGQNISVNGGWYMS